MFQGRVSDVMMVPTELCMTMLRQRRDSDVAVIPEWYALCELCNRDVTVLAVV